MDALPSRVDLATESEGRQSARKTNYSFFLSPCATVCPHTLPHFVNNNSVNNVCLGRTAWRAGLLDLPGKMNEMRACPRIENGDKPILHRGRSKVVRGKGSLYRGRPAYI